VISKYLVISPLLWSAHSGPARKATFANSAAPSTLTVDSTTTSLCRRTAIDQLQSGFTCNGERLGSIAASYDTLRIANVTVLGMLRLDYAQTTESRPRPAVIIANGVTFAGPVVVNGLRGTSLRFVGCTFNSVLNLAGDTVAMLDLRLNRYAGAVILMNDVARSFVANGSAFHGTAEFNNISAEAVNLIDDQFFQVADFTGAHIGVLKAERIRAAEPIRITWVQFGDTWERWMAPTLRTAHDWTRASVMDPRNLHAVEQELQFWRANFDRLNEEGDKRAVNLELIRFRRTCMDQPWSMRYASYLMELPTAYGTAPLRLVWTTALLIGAYATVYYLLDRRAKECFSTQKKDGEAIDRHPRALFALMYSLDTFLPFVEITGVKQWGWCIAGRARWIEVSERVVGIVTVAIATYCLTAYYV
jgi:hypothetical protein